MTTGLVLIAAILVLGGVIATVGDRIGMRVGKARLTWFNLRPRQTATLITILTGVLISAITFGMLFAVDGRLRTGVFELGRIQRDLSTARQELQQTQTDKQQIEGELSSAQRRQAIAQQRLKDTNLSLQRSQAEQKRTEAQVNSLRDEITKLQADRQRQIEERDAQIARRDDEIVELQELQADRQQQIAEQERELAQQNRLIAESNQRIEASNRAIAERERRLSQLEQQRDQLEQDVASLQGLRDGNLALTRNQVLISRPLRVLEPDSVPQAIEQILRDANRFALSEILPSASREQVILRVSPQAVESAIRKLQTGGEYVVRVLSNENYLVGETCVLIGGDPCIEASISADPYKVVFQAGDIVGLIGFDPSTVGGRRLAEQYEQLILISRNRSRDLGYLGGDVRVAGGNPDAVSTFLRQVAEYNRPLEILAIAANTVYTVGPIDLELAAINGNQLLFSTFTLPPIVPPTESPIVPNREP